MTRRDPDLALRHMTEHGREVVAMVAGRSRADLDADRQLELSVVRLLEIVGEAANRVPRERQRAFPGVPWPEIVGLRNRLIHGYDSVDLDIVWEIVTRDIPALLRELERGD